jgi:hypothetical protein
MAARPVNTKKFMDPSVDEDVDVTIRIARHGHPTREERLVLAERVAKECRLHFPEARLVRVRKAPSS